MKTVRQSSSQIGRWAEDLAYAYLCEKGLQGVERNYRCPRGEMDLIMRQGDILVFVEVRYRARQCYGSGLESVDMSKQRRMVAIADEYLYKHREAREYRCRFDVVAISGSQRNPQLSWVADAFRGE
jgi:putative endonuclease